MRSLAATALAAALAVPLPARAGEVGRIDLDALDYRESPLFAGVATATAVGDRTVPGLYATHARVREGARIPPHTHPNTLTTWVTAGTAYVGIGEVVDPDALVAYPAGSFFVTPAGVPHFIVAEDGPFAILDHGAGPSGITLVGAANGEHGAELPIRRVDAAALATTAMARFPGVATAMITGAFDAPGLYAAKGEMAAGSTFPPHRHPDQRLTLVLSGTMYLGQGEVFDEAALTAYPAGTLAITPAGTPHFMAARDGAFTVLEIGAGPSGMAFTAN